MRYLRLLLFMVHCILFTELAAQDTALVRLWVEQAQQFYEANTYDSSLVWYEKAASSYANHQYWEPYLDCQVAIAKNYRRKGDFNQALNIAQQAVEVLEKQALTQSLTATYVYDQIGEIYYKKGKYQQALAYYQQSLTLREELSTTTDLDLSLSYNLFGNLYTTMDKHPEALTFHQKALAIRERILGVNHPKVATTYNNLANALYYLGRRNEARQHYEKALDIRLANYGDDHPDVAMSYNNLGFIHKKQRRFQKGIQYYEKGLAVRKRLLGETHPDLVKAYNNLGSIYSDLGDYSTAVFYYVEGLRIGQQKLGEFHPTVARIYNNLGLVYKEQGNYTRALQYYDKALESYLLTFDEQHSRVALTYTNIGAIHSNRGDYAAATSYHQKALGINQAVFGTQHPKVGLSYQAFGTTAFRQGHYEEALTYYHKSLKVFLGTVDTQHPFLVEIYNSLAHTYKAMGNYPLALEHYEGAITANAPDLEVSQDSIFRAFFPLEMLHALQGKAFINQYAYGVTEQNEQLQTAYQTWIIADQLIDTLRHRFQNYEDLIRFNQTAHQVYEGAIQACHKLYQQTQDAQYLNQAFHFAEKSKANALLVGIYASGALRFSGIPDSLVQREQQYRVDIAFYQQSIFDAQQRQNEEQATTYQNHLSRTYNQYAALIKLLETSYPRYYELKYSNQSATPADIRKQLPDEQTAFIEYFLGDSSLYVFVVTQETFDMRPLTLPANFNARLQDFRVALSGQVLNAFDTASAPYYYQEAHAFYNILLKASFDAMPSVPTRLILAPDGALGYLPFEILLTESVNLTAKNRYADLPYLLRQSAISYTYSGAHLNRNRHNDAYDKSKTSYAYGGFAPHYQEATLLSLQASRGENTPYFSSHDSLRGSIYDLPYTREQVRYATELWDGRSWLAQEATEYNFKQYAPQCAILDLAMHGFVDNQQPLHSGLLFADDADSLENNYLTAAELYSMRLHAQLGVLGACNTGFGEIRKGEGVMSLSRAFTYAGCPSLVMSLWNIPDQATATILRHFYEALKTGMPKDKALQLAKLRYLEEQPERVLHPSYWAGCVQIGDVEAIAPRNNRTFLWWIFGAIVLLLCLPLIRRHRKSLSVQ